MAISREELIAAIQQRLERVKDANIRAYVNRDLVEDLFSLDSKLALDRPTAQETMYTTSAFERQVLRRELNAIADGLGNNPDIVEQYAYLKALHARNAIAGGGRVPTNSAAGFYDVLAQ